MNKNDLWTAMNKAFLQAENGVLEMSVSFFGYIEEGTGTIMAIEYDKHGFSLNTLIETLNEFEKQKKIEVISTENMGYCIVKI